MKVAVVAMGVMEVTRHAVVDVIPVRNRFVAAIRPMLVVRGMSIALMRWRTERRISRHSLRCDGRVGGLSEPVAIISVEVEPNLVESGRAKEISWRDVATLDAYRTLRELNANVLRRDQPILLFGARGGRGDR